MSRYPVARAITRRSGSNLALAFAGLSPERRAGMEVLYAFCREVDDLADEPGLTSEERLAGLDLWERDVRASADGAPERPLARELAEVVRVHGVPVDALLEIIEGMRMDVRGTRYATWGELRTYCWRVASCVGFASQAVFGVRDGDGRAYAEALGLALQCTNIVRDVRADHAIGRVYLPDEDFARAGVDRASWRGGDDAGSRQVYRLMGERASRYFAEARALLPARDHGAFVAARAMAAVYGAVLEAARASGWRVWAVRPRVPKWRKLTLLGSERRARPGRSVPPRRTVVVVGAGFAGLAAAVGLARQGHRVSLVEARATPGGRTHSFHERATGDEVDNGQHVLMGCYRATLEFLESLGVRERLWEPAGVDIPFVSAEGMPSRLRAGRLGRAGAVLGFDVLSWGERARLPRVVRAASRPVEPGTTAARWLAACGQSAGAVRALWGPLCVGALNAEPERADAGLFAEVVRRVLGGAERDAAVVVPRVGLGALFLREAIATIEACGGTVRTGCAVAGLVWDGGRVHGVQLANGARLNADGVVSAVPWAALRHWIPGDAALGRQLGRLRGAPILNVTLWWDRAVLGEPFTGVWDSPVQWVFDVARVTGAGSPRTAVVLSAAEAWRGVARNEVVARVRAELERILPAARGAELRHALVYNAPDATLAAEPEVVAARPGARTEWDGLVLAGGWTNTGLPDTIEGAVVSGQRAAACIAGE
jgi:squalene-associated FAD-dependent desaturase